MTSFPLPASSLSPFHTVPRHWMDARRRVAGLCDCDRLAGQSPMHQVRHHARHVLDHSDHGRRGCFGPQSRRRPPHLLSQFSWGWTPRPPPRPPPWSSWATGEAVMMAFCPRGRARHSSENDSRMADWNLPWRGPRQSWESCHGANVCECCPLCHYHISSNRKSARSPTSRVSKSVRAYSPFPTTDLICTCNSGKSVYHGCQHKQTQTDISTSWPPLLPPPRPTIDGAIHRPSRSGITKLWL